MNYHSNVNYDWKNRTVLIAEDDEMSFRYIELVLSRRTNINIIWAITGQQAVDFCKMNKHIDFVMMDIQLPVFDGFEAIKRIKKFNPDVPIIVQTANALNDERDKCKNIGAVGYVTKPINLTVLFSMIDSLLKPVTVHN